MPRSKGRCGRPWIRARARCLSRGLPCYICGQRIDYTLPYRDPWTQKVNLRSATAHHPIPLALGGHPYDIEPAHLDCNIRVGDTVFIPQRTLITSRQW